MAARLSRRKLASFIARQILADNDEIFDQVANLLIHEKRLSEAGLLVRDIEEQLASMGHLIVTVETARPIDDSLRAEIRRRFYDQTVYLREVVRPELIGGIRLLTPEKMLDQSIKKKLNDLKLAA